MKIARPIASKKQKIFTKKNEWEGMGGGGVKGIYSYRNVRKSLKKRKQLSF